MTRKVANTSSGKAADSGATSAASMIRPPTSGNVANVARLAISRGPGLRARTWSTSTAAMPIAVAGAGPSSAAASTSARKDPEIRCPPWLTANQSVARASPNSSATRAGGSQSAALEVSAATEIATTSTTASETTSAVDRVDK